jgi:hypothetical protein
MLQIAHVYRDLGFANDAYALAIGAFEAWGRAPADPILLPYEQATLADDFRAQTLARQGESALRAHAYAVAVQRFEQALGFQPASRYLQDRLGAAQRAVQKYGPGDAREDF